jgi:hypothetical protein
MANLAYLDVTARLIMLDDTNTTAIIVLIFANNAIAALHARIDANSPGANVDPLRRSSAEAERQRHCGESKLFHDTAPPDRKNSNDISAARFPAGFTIA